MSKIKFEISDEETKAAVNRIYKMKDRELVEEFTFLTNYLSGEPTTEEVEANRINYFTLGFIHQQEFKRRNIQFLTEVSSRYNQNKEGLEYLELLEKARDSQHLTRKQRLTKIRYELDKVIAIRREGGELK